MAVEVGVPLDGAGLGLVVAVLGGVDGDFDGLLVGCGVVVARGVVSFFGSGVGELLGLVVTGVPSGAMVTTTGAGGRTMR